MRIGRATRDTNLGRVFIVRTKMATRRMNLNSPSLQGRIKKYDRYEHRAGRSLRTSTVLPTRSNKPKSQTQHRQSTPTSSAQTITQANDRLKKKSHLVQLSTSRITSQKLNNIATSRNQRSQAPPHSQLALQAVATSREERTSDGVFITQFSDGLSPFYGTVKNKLSKLQKLMYGVGLSVFVIAAVASVQSFSVNNQVQEQAQTLGTRADEQGVSEGTGNEPAEDPVSEDAVRSYQVAPEEPRYLRIPELGVSARIKGLGVTAEGAVDAPWNIHDVGWYNKGARPGANKGSSLLLGHVSGWTGPGVFKRINELKEGSQFEVEKGSGEIIRYEVVRSEELALEDVDMRKILHTEVPGEHDMKLMTCSGTYNRDTETYEQRFIVYARHVK